MDSISVERRQLGLLVVLMSLVPYSVMIIVNKLIHLGMDSTVFVFQIVQYSSLAVAILVMIFPVLWRRGLTLSKVMQSFLGGRGTVPIILGLAPVVLWVAWALLFGDHHLRTSSVFEVLKDRTANGPFIVFAILIPSLSTTVGILILASATRQSDRMLALTVMYVLQIAANLMYYAIVITHQPISWNYLYMVMGQASILALVLSLVRLGKGNNRGLLAFMAASFATQLLPIPVAYMEKTVIFFVAAIVTLAVSVRRDSDPEVRVPPIFDSQSV